MLRSIQLSLDLDQLLKDGCLSWVLFLRSHSGDHWVHAQLLRPFSRPVRQSALRRVLVVPNVFHFRMMEATVILGTFSAAEIFVASPHLSPDTVASLSSGGSSSDLRQILSAVRPYTDRCVSSWIYHSRVQLGWRNILKIIKTKFKHVVEKFRFLCHKDITLKIWKIKRIYWEFWNVF